MTGRRKYRVDPGEVIVRLVAVKRMVAGIKDAMPTMAGELRREACETIDEIIEDVRRLA